MTASPALEVRDAVLLAHAVAVHVARQAGVRALIIKGPTGAAHGLRPERVSADADVWVEPARLDDYLAALAQVGWVKRPVSESYDDLVVHSVTLIHEGWPCDIDVHREFPGFLGPAGDVFDALWSRRVPLEVAGIQADMVDRPGAILVTALHALRTPSQTARHGQELRRLASEVVPQLGAAEQQDLLALAVATGAVDSARVLLEALDVDLPAPTPPGVDPALDRWRERTAGAGTVTGQRWMLVRSRPWRERPRLLWRALWPTDHELRLDHPEIPAGASALRKARWRRVARGLRALPGALRAQASARRGETDHSLLDTEGERP